MCFNCCQMPTTKECLCYHELNTCKYFKTRRLYIFYSQPHKFSLSNHTPVFISPLFSTQSQCCLTFSCTELQVLLRCCLIHISIIILRHFLYLLYLCPCLVLGLFKSYLCDLFSFSSSFSLIHKYRHACSFAYFLEYVPSFLNDNLSASGCCLAFAWFLTNFSLALLIKMLLIKKSMQSMNTLL